jgi:hypothetical protein
MSLILQLMIGASSLIDCQAAIRPGLTRSGESVFPAAVCYREKRHPVVIRWA